MEIVNKVAQSGLHTIDLETYFPEDKICGFDLKSFLFRELILKEKDFREAMAAVDWSQYANKILAIHCTADAIIPQWAYMLVTVYAAPYAEKIYLADPEQALHKYYEEIVHDFDTAPYEGQRIVVKGCSKHPVPADAYVALTRKLRPVARSIMYGEPCSTVPLFKRRDP